MVSITRLLTTDGSCFFSDFKLQLILNNEIYANQYKLNLIQFVFFCGYTLCTKTFIKKINNISHF